jgi:soluble lytic murein transglycosylase-like protein
MSVRRTLTTLAVATTIALGGVVFAREVVAVAAEAEAGRLNRAILEYVAKRNPRAPRGAFQGFPAVLVAEAQRTNLDHCLALAVAEVESSFRHDAVGRAGEVGLFQILPSTAAAFEAEVGRGRLGDLADPVVSTRFAMAYLRHILARKPSLRDALTEYNGGPAGRRPHYYRTVMGAYVEVLEHAELRCLLRRGPARRPLFALLGLA